MEQTQSFVVASTTWRSPIGDPVTVFCKMDTVINAEYVLGQELWKPGELMSEKCSTASTEPPL